METYCLSLKAFQQHCKTFLVLVVRVSVSVLSEDQCRKDGALENFFLTCSWHSCAFLKTLIRFSLPYMSGFSDTSFIGAFAAFGGVEAINIIVNSCAYALLFWLAVVIFKYTIGLIPLLLRLIA